jgi:hypothetical protein
MDKLDFIRARPNVRTELPRDINGQVLVNEAFEEREENPGGECDSFVAGLIVDSWVESAPPTDAGAHLILQVAPRGHPNDLVIVEAEVALVPDRLWLEDLSENLCHGSPVQAFGSRLFNGLFAATRLQLTR